MSKEDKNKEIVVEVAPEPVPQITFETWFRITGAPEHHINAYRTYAGNTAGLKPKETWDKIFQNF